MGPGSRTYEVNSGSDHYRRRPTRPNYGLRRGIAALVMVTLLALVVVVVSKQFKSPAHASPTTSTPAASTRRSSSTTTSVPPTTVVNLQHWPQGLPAAFLVPTSGITGTNYHAKALSIASLTKMMTAVLVEQHLPLGTVGDGPVWTVTAQDLAMTASLAHEDGITIAVSQGEQLSERLLLEGLLVHSANNYGVMLAELTGLSESQFIADMNQEATALGMTHTTYVDTNGISPSDRSTPSDQVLVAAQLERYGLLASIVAMTSVHIPGVGEEQSFTPLVGTRGVIGIKSGTLAATGANDVLAIDPTIGGVVTPIYVAVLHVTGYPNITIAGTVDLTIAHEVAHYLNSN